MLRNSLLTSNTQNVLTQISYACL